MLIVQKFRGANTLEVTRGVEDGDGASCSPGCPASTVDTTIFRPATFIEQSIDNLTEAMLIGILLVILIIIAFLFEWRTAFISLIAIPLSLVAALLVLDLRGDDRQRDGARRAGGRDRGGRRRRDHRRREHRPTAAAGAGRGQRHVDVRGSCWTPRSRSARRSPTRR